MSKVKNEFWREWVEADEIGRIKKVRELGLFYKNAGNDMAYISPSMMNAFLEDLYDFLKEPKDNRKGERHD